jgi:excisionase family DNA binding protein
LLKGGAQHVRNMVKREQLGHFRLGGKLLRIPRAAVDEAKRAMMAEPRPTPAKKR